MNRLLYKKGNICIDSDFDIRVVREEGSDIDLFIPTDNRTINLYMEDKPNYLCSRLQFPMVRNIILRFSKDQNNNICTVHFLRNIDLQSAVVNFELEYIGRVIKLIDREFYIEMKMTKAEI